MKVKGFATLLTFALGIGLSPQIANAADSPSFEIKSVSATAINPGDTVTWKIQVNLVPGWVKYLSLTLRTPSGDIRSISALVDSKSQINSAISKEILLELKTNSYDIPGKYKILYGYIANEKEFYAYDPINAKEYAGKDYMVAQNLSQFDFTLRDSGTGVQKTPQFIESVAFSKTQVDPGSNSKLQIKTSGTGTLVSVSAQITTPDGIIYVNCDATQQDYVNSCKELINNEGKYSFYIPVWTAEDSTPGNYKITQINIAYRNGEGLPFINDTATWGGNVVYEDSENIYNGLKAQKLSRFAPSGLAFTLLDAGQGILQAPIWTELSWKSKSVAAGETATLIVKADGFTRYLGNISVPMLTTLGSKNEFVYTNQNGSSSYPRQINPEKGITMLPATKSGTFEVDVYIPRSAKPGIYGIGQIQILSTTCKLTNMKDIYTNNALNNQNCQSWPNGSHTSFYMWNLSKDFGASGIIIPQWKNFVNPFMSQIEITAAAPLSASKVEEVEVSPYSIEYRYPYSTEKTCTPTSTLGDVIDEQVIRENYWIFKVNNLKPDAALTVTLTCTDGTGEKAVSSINSRSSKPIAPASPKLTLDSATTTSATFSIGIREGFKYSITAETGVAAIQGNKVEVTNLKPGVKTFIIATITDAYGQSTSSEPFYFAAALPEKPAKPLISAGKITTTRVEFSYEKRADLDYELTVSEGNVSDIKGKVSVSGLEPNTKVIATLKVTDQFGQSSSSDDFVIKSAIPELPVLPTLFFSKASADSISLRFAPRSGLKYQVKVSSGSAAVIDGTIVITGLKAAQKVQVTLLMSDQYGQVKYSDTYTFTSAANPKTPVKSTITCVKGKSSKVITGVNPVCPTGYSKK